MNITRENVFDHVTKTVNEFSGSETFTSTDGRLKIIARKCIAHHGPRDFMTLWKKAGYIEKELDTFISVDVYYTDENNCVSKYHPTIKRDENNWPDINFDYIKEWTEENIIDIVIACLNMREENGMEAMYKEAILTDED